MSLGRPCFYTYGPDDICHAHVRGQSRPAVITGMNEDESVDLVVFTNGPRDGIMQQTLCKYDVPVRPGAVPGCAGIDEAEGSTAIGKVHAASRALRVAEANALIQQQAAEALRRLQSAESTTVDGAVARIDENTWEKTWSGWSDSSVKTRVDPALVAGTPEPSLPATPVAEPGPMTESTPSPDETHRDTTGTEASPHGREPEGQGPLLFDGVHEPAAEPHTSSTEGSESA